MYNLYVGSAASNWQIKNIKLLSFFLIISPDAHLDWSVDPISNAMTKPVKELKDNKRGREKQKYIPYVDNLSYEISGF